MTESMLDDGGQNTLISTSCISTESSTTSRTASRVCRHQSCQRQQTTPWHANQPYSQHVGLWLQRSYEELLCWDVALAAMIVPPVTAMVPCKVCAGNGNHTSSCLLSATSALLSTRIRGLLASLSNLGLRPVYGSLASCTSNIQSHLSTRFCISRKPALFWHDT